MVKVPSGGRKRKLNLTVAKTATAASHQNPQLAETSSTASKNVSATVVEFACATCR
jgi:hypothetical protein